MKHLAHLEDPQGSTKRGRFPRSQPQPPERPRPAAAFIIRLRLALSAIAPTPMAEEFVSIPHEHPASDDLFSHYPEQGDGEVMVIQTP